MRKPNAKCEVCGKPLYRRPADLERYNHICCKGCRSELYKRERNYHQAGLEKGQGWNKGMNKANGDTLAYGKPRSKETKRRISESLRAILVKVGKTYTCPVCGKEFYLFPSEIERGYQHCSRECADISRLRQETRTCTHCGKEFTTNQAREQFLCSRECALEYKGPTDIEILMDEWLNNSGLEYESQKPLCDVTIADFFVEPNIAIYCDGDYWHNLPKNRQRDSFVNRTLRTNGYRVIRLWGSEIKRGARPVELLYQK